MREKQILGPKDPLGHLSVKILKMFSAWVNLSLQFAKKVTYFALFLSIFLRNQSLSNVRWFYGKKRKIGREICI